MPAYWLPAPYPFAGLVAWWPWHALQLRAVLLVALPALLVAPLAVVAIRTSERDGIAWALALNLLWLVVFLPFPSWVDINGSARLSNGVVLAAVLCVPLWTRRQRAWFLVPAVVWCLLTPLVIRSLLRAG